MSDVWSWAGAIWRSNQGWDRPIFLAKAVIWQMRRRIGGKFVARLRNGARIMVQPSSAFSPMFYGRLVEEQDALFLKRHAGLAPTFVDVGANVGLFSAQLFDAFERFHLFEPAPSSFAALQATLALNPAVKAVAYNVAVSDAPGDLPFLDEGNCSTTSHAPRQAATGTTIVRADTLDRLLPAEVGPFVLKVDVEGLEEQVFRGALEHFRARRPKLVQFERLGRTNLDAVRRFFDEAQYTLFALTEDGKITRDPAAVARPLINLFACTAADFEMLARSESAAR